MAKGSRRFANIRQKLSECPGDSLTSALAFALRDSSESVGAYRVFLPAGDSDKVVDRGPFGVANCRQDRAELAARLSRA